MVSQHSSSKPDQIGYHSPSAVPATLLFKANRTYDFPDLPLRNEPHSGVLGEGGRSVHALGSNEKSSPVRQSITCLLDCEGHIKLTSSPLLRSRLSEIFSDPFCHKFLKIVAEEDPAVRSLALSERIERTIINDISHEALAVDSRADLTEGSALSNTACPRTKPITKRWKPSREAQAKLPSSTEVTGHIIVKREDDSNTSESDPEDSGDSAGFVDAGYTLRPIRVDDSVTLDKCIEAIFDYMQQMACKRIAKAWIKSVEPLKQTNFPYNGGKKKREAATSFGDQNPGEITRPEWWPPSEGWPDHGCRHKEPDHLKKPERILLLKHMLKVFGPDRLSESTKHLMRSNPLNFQQERTGTHENVKPFPTRLLNHIYHIRRHQERYENNELDGSTTISVQFPEKVRKACKVKTDPGCSALSSRKSSSFASHKSPVRLCSPGADPHPQFCEKSQQRLASDARSPWTLFGNEDPFVSTTKTELDDSSPVAPTSLERVPPEATMEGLERAAEQKIQTLDHGQGFMPPRSAHVTCQPQGELSDLSFNQVQAYNPASTEMGIACPPKAVSSRDNWGGLTGFATTSHSGAVTRAGHGLPEFWSSETLFNERYDFGHACMSTPSLSSIQTEFPMPQGQTPITYGFQHSGPYPNGQRPDHVPPNLGPRRR